MQVKKRNGNVVDFDAFKIFQAIQKASLSTSEIDMSTVEEITTNVVKSIQDRNALCIDIEDIQDIVETTLIKHGFIQTARSYIRYREQHKQLRQDINTSVDVTSSMTEYLQRKDWRVNANANQGYSLGGLILNSSGKMTANYWLNHLYPPEVSNAHKEGSLHIHDLDMLTNYCCGWSLRKLLEDGLNGVPNKVGSNPPKHLSSAIGQMVNFLGTLQNEWAGAMAFSSFDTYLAPFIRVDNLPYSEIKQQIQQFIFNLNVPSRWGGQCVDELTECLTTSGWKNYKEMSKNDTIYTINMSTHDIEVNIIQDLNIYDYRGDMVELKNRVTHQLVTPNHRVVRQKFNSSDIEFVEASDLAKFKTPPNILLSANPIKRGGTTLSTNEIKLLAWILSDASIEKTKDRIRIYQSKPKYIEEIENLLKALCINYKKSIRNKKSLDFNSDSKLKKERLPSTYFSIYGDTARFWKNYTDSERNKIPVDFKMNATADQIHIFLEEYIKADGCSIKKDRIYKKYPTMINDLQEIMVLGGIGTVVRNSKTSNNVRTIRFLKRKVASVTHINTKYYDGKVWCPTTDNGTFFARREGKVFITGNSPFSNVTLDFTIPHDLRGHNPKIGGKYLDITYGELQEEADLINKAFMETMRDGDYQHRPFAFPIPTINITKDFPWESENSNLLFELTSKYGTPYFQNFINSDLDPSMIRSMCPLHNSEVILHKSTRYSRPELTKISNFTENKVYEVFCEGKYVAGTFIKIPNKNFMEITLCNNHKLITTTDHENLVLTSDNKEVTLSTSQLTDDMYLPYSLTPYVGNGGTYEMGYLVGAYAGDGSIAYKSTIFSLNTTTKQHINQKIIDIVEKYFGAKYSTSVDGKLFTLRIMSSAVKGLCEEFVCGKKTNKYYNTSLLETSIEFRQGVLQGHLDTDGGNRHRIYTSSKKMVTMLNLLCASLGTTTAITEDNRDGRFSTNTNYGVLIYQLNRESYGDIWKKYNNRLWVKIKGVNHKKYSNDSTGYCFSMLNTDKPLFMVGTTGILTHNCRLRISLDELISKGNGLFGSAELTGSLGVVTLNMARLGYIHKHNSNKLFESIDNLLAISKTCLVLKRKASQKFLDQGLYPFTKHFLGHYDNHFLTIGINGLNECVENFFNGTEDIGTERGKTFSIDILTYLRNKMIDFQKETGYMFNLEATPAESASYRFAKEDKKRYPDIKQAGTPENPYYTNSSQLPVNYTDDLYKSLSLQDELQTLYTGGTVFHVFLGESPSPEISKKLVKRIFTNFKMPYITLTPVYSICPIHGYISGKHEYCPKCDSELVEQKLFQSINKEEPYNE